MGRYTSGSEAAKFIFDNVIPEVKKCANEINRKASPEDRLAQQIDCVLKAFGKKK